MGNATSVPPVPPLTTETIASKGAFTSLDLPSQLSREGANKEMVSEDLCISNFCGSEILFYRYSYSFTNEKRQR